MLEALLISPSEQELSRLNSVLLVYHWKEINVIHIAFIVCHKFSLPDLEDKGLNLIFVLVNHWLVFSPKENVLKHLDT